MNQRLFLSVHPEGRQIMTFALRQSLEVLQMPQQELAQWLLTQIEDNPLLELDFPRSKKGFEGDFPSPHNLYDHLRAQIRENFSAPDQLKIAEKCLEHLDEKGFLSSSFEEIENGLHQEIAPILAVLQTFDPPGIFARNLQEALLLQLRAKGKEKSLAFQIVETSFTDLLHGRYSKLKKKLKESDISKALKDLAHLSFRPADAYRQEPSLPIYPDLSIQKVEGAWTLEVVEEELPRFTIHEKYLELEIESPQEKEALRLFEIQAKGLCRSLSRRKKLLQEIGRILICKQAAFLEHKGPLRSLSMKELAQKLSVHESTLSRALAGKYALTPRGLLPLRSFISKDPEASTAKELVEQLIQNEDKHNPLTDDELAKKLHAKGHCVARRTISKYRSQLKIGSIFQRKHSYEPNDVQQTTSGPDDGTKSR